jgi:hypothetical protein
LARVPAIVALQAAYWRAVRRALDDRRSCR